MEPSYCISHSRRKSQNEETSLLSKSFIPDVNHNHGWTHRYFNQIRSKNKPNTNKNKFGANHTVNSDALHTQITQIAYRRVDVESKWSLKRFRCLSNCYSNLRGTNSTLTHQDGRKVTLRCRVATPGMDQARPMHMQGSRSRPTKSF